MPPVQSHKKLELPPMDHFLCLSHSYLGPLKLFTPTLLRKEITE